MPPLSRSASSRRGGSAGGASTGSSQWDAIPGTPSLWPRRATEDGGVGRVVGGRLGADCCPTDTGEARLPGKLESRRAASYDIAGLPVEGVSALAPHRRQQQQKEQQQRQQQWDQGWGKEEETHHHHRAVVATPGTARSQPKVRAFFSRVARVRMVCFFFRSVSCFVLIRFLFFFLFGIVFALFFV